MEEERREEREEMASSEGGEEEEREEEEMEEEEREEREEEREEERVGWGLEERRAEAREGSWRESLVFLSRWRRAGVGKDGSEKRMERSGMVREVVGGEVEEGERCGEWEGRRRKSFFDILMSWF